MTSTTEIVIIILSNILVFAIISACCRGLSRAYERHIITEEMAQRRRAFYMDPNNAIISPNSTAHRAVRVTTISREGDTIAMGVYEIHMPRNSRPPNRSRAQRPRVIDIQPPPPFSTAYEVSSPVTRIDNNMEEPPPSYDEYMKVHSTSHLEKARF